MKPRLLLARLCDLCHYSWKAARANRFPKILFIKKQTQWSNDKTIIKLGYRKISWIVSRSIICLSLRPWQIIDLLATDKSRYFAQPRPIIANYLSFYFYKRYVYLDCCVKLSFSLLIPTFQCLYRTGCNIAIILFQFSFVNYSKSSRSKLIHQCDFLVWNFLPVCLRWHKWFVGEREFDTLQILSFVIWYLSLSRETTR